MDENVDFDLDLRPIMDHEAEQADTSFDGTTQLGSQQLYTPGDTAEHIDLTRQPSLADSRSVTPETPSLPQKAHERVSRRAHSQILQPKNEDARVSKKRRAHASPTASPAQRPSQMQPSEEDILLLLMALQRKHSESHDRLTRDHEQLQARYDRLCSDYSASHKELEETKQQWHTSVRANHVRESDFRQFKDKYSKLKDWAHSLMQDCQTLHEGREAFRTDLDVLKSESLIEAEAKDKLHQQFMSATSQIADFKASIAAIRADAVKIETVQNVQLNNVQKELSTAREHIREQKCQNRQHAQYIERLESSQWSMHATFAQKQDEIRAEISKLAGIVVKDEELDALTTIIAPIADVLGDLRQRPTQHLPTDEMQNLMTTITQHHEILQEVLARVKTGQTDHHASSQLQLSDLLNVITNLKLDLETAKSLDKSNVVLSEKVKHSMEMLRASEREKHVGQLFTTGLLEAHKQTVHAVTMADNRHKNDEQIRHWQGKFNEQTLLAQSLQQELDQVRPMLSEAEDILAESAKKSEDVFQEHQTELIVLKKRHAEELALKNSVVSDLQKMIAALEDKVKQGSHQMKGKELELSKKVELLSGLQDEQNVLVQQVAQMESLSREVDTLRPKALQLKALEEQLESVKMGKDDLEHQLAAAQSETSKLEQRLQNAEVNSRAAQEDLAKRHKSAEQERNEARQELQKMNDLKQKYNTLLTIQADEYAAKQDLEKRLESARECAQKLPAITEELDAAQDMIRDLELSLKAAQDEAGRISGLEIDLRNSTNEREQLRHDVEAREADIKGYVTRNNQLKDEVKELADHAIKVKELELELLDVRQESETKDAEMARMQDQINELDQDNQRFVPIKQYMSDAEIAAFDEPIVLSFKTVIHQSQSQPEELDGDDAESDEFTSPRRAANRHPAPAYDGVVVPDSQSQGHNLPPNGHATEGAIDKEIAAMFDWNKATQVSNDEVLDELPVQPTALTRSASDLRPETANSEMLLRSSDGVNISPIGRTLHRRSPDVQVPGTADGPSPMKTRGGSQIRHNMAAPTLTAVPGSPHTNSRASPAPNSAAKRMRTTEPTASQAKRPRSQANLENLQVRTAPKAVATPKNLRFASEDEVYDMPSSSSKAGSITGTTAPAPGKNKKKTNTTKVSSREKAFGARFSAT